MIGYPVGSSGQFLVFSDQVLAHFARYRQSRWWHREAGGQLFARFALPEIIIEEATGPRRGDRRTRYAYRPNRASEQREIMEQHSRGLHFVGDWHTHPEAIPVPSGEDLHSLVEMVERSEHALNGFLLVIVGTQRPPAGLYVSLNDGLKAHRLEPSADGIHRTDRLQTIADRIGA